MTERSWNRQLVVPIRLLAGTLVAVYFFFSLVPAYYVAVAKLPPTEQLKVSEGPLVFDWMGDRGYLTGVRLGKDEQFFTCAGWIKSNNDCIDTPNPRASFGGRHAKIWWFDQPVYFSKSYRRVARIDVDGEPTVLYEKTGKRMQWASSYAPLWTAGFLLFTLIGVACCEVTARKMQRAG